MSLPKGSRQRTLFDTPLVLEDMFEETNRYRLFHEKVMPVMWGMREELAKLYCDDNGRAAIEPVMMGAVTVLQYMENKPDRQAAEAVRLHLGWKYALGLPLDYGGFHATSLVVFRERLLAAEKGPLVFDGVLETLRAAGLVKRRNKQRLDSTHIVGNVARMGRLEMVRETLRLAVELAEKGGVRPPSMAELVERYCEADVDWRCQDKEKLGAKMQQAGEDGVALLRWLEAQPGLCSHKTTALLKRVLEEQFETEGGSVTRKEKEESGVVKNPHDPDAQWAAKDKNKEKQWVGFKVQVAETVAETPAAKKKGEPTTNFITDITTTEAIASDKDGMKRSLDAQEGRGLEHPSEHFVDGAYVCGETMAKAIESGGELVGPMQAAPQRSQGIYSTEAFDVDIEHRTAVCPAGKLSTEFGKINDGHQGTTYYRIQWGHQCDTCELQQRCTSSGDKRRVLCVSLRHDLVQARRREMLTPVFKKRMKQRNAMEGTISELARNGMRRTRYRGLAKTNLANLFHGAACNIRRWLRLIAWTIDQSGGGGQRAAAQKRGFFSGMPAAAALA
jgi:transposase